MKAGAVLSAVAGVALLIAAPAVAEQPKHALSKADMDFIKEAAIGGQFEVATGKLAEQNGANPQVKQFGARMVQDHGSAGALLTAIATGKGATMPQELDAEHKALHDRLAGLKGSEFDRAYMQTMLKAHDEDAQKFGKEATNGTDEDIKRFAKTTLAVIKEHDKMAHEIAGSLSATGSSTAR